MSLRKAINDKCKECIHDPLSGLGTWRQQTEGCTSKDCPLWPVRPVTTGKKTQGIGQNGGKKQQNDPV